jgi:hypothetical protein
MTEQQNPEKSISEQLSDALKKLSVDQVRYVVARMDYPTKGEAAVAIGLKPDTVYRWNGEVERAVELMALDTVESAKAIRIRNLLKAMAIKVKGLDSEDESIRQKVATELIEWELGKATQKTDLSNSDGTLKPPQVIEVIKTYVKDDDATN